jgi:hypothetical protein
MNQIERPASLNRFRDSRSTKERLLDDVRQEMLYLIQNRAERLKR